MVQIEPLCVAMYMKFMDACAVAKLSLDRHFLSPALALIMGMHVVELGALRGWPD